MSIISSNFQPLLVALLFKRACNTLSAEIVDPMGISMFLVGDSRGWELNYFKVGQWWCHEGRVLAHGHWFFIFHTNSAQCFYFSLGNSLCLSFSLFIAELFTALITTNVRRTSEISAACWQGMSLLPGLTQQREGVHFPWNLKQSCSQLSIGPYLSLYCLWWKPASNRKFCN